MPGKARRGPRGPMDEENFPARSPTRDAVEKEMDEADNLSGSSSPTPGRRLPVEDEDSG